MRKPRPQALDVLTAEQRVTLDEMLFSDNKGYAAASSYLKEAFGLSISRSTLGTYFRRRARENLDRAVLAAAGQTTIHAAGVQITVRCSRPGEITVEMQPL